jgi:hypothetical protein
VNVAVAAPALLPRARLRCVRDVALVLWLPALVPLLCGMLRDCEHCLYTYLAMLPIVPGAIVPALLDLRSAWWFVVAALPVLAMGGVLYVLWREAPRAVCAVAGAIVAAVVAAQGFGLCFALRQ